MPNPNLKIAVFSNTFGPKDAMGKHLHLIKKIFPQAEIFLERGNEDPSIPAHPFYFVRRYPYLALYMLEWKLGRKFIFLSWLFKPLAKIAFFFEAKKFARYDVVWVQWGLYYQAINLIPALARLKRRPKIIFDYHGVTPPEQINSPGKRLMAERTIDAMREAVGLADICLVRSRFMAQELSCYGKPKKIIFNPLPFLLIKAREINVRGQNNLKEKKILLYVGRISSHKNLEVVIRALAEIKDKNLIFVVVGNFRHKSLGEEKVRLEKVAGKLGVLEQIKFQGEIEDSELLAWYQAAHLFVMPSLHEGFCWPLVDAMAYGAPILATREGAIPETVGGAALFFDAKDFDQLAEKINQILSDNVLREKLVLLGKEKVKEYSFKRYKKDLIAAVL